MPVGLLCPSKLQQNSTIQHVQFKYLEKRLFCSAERVLLDQCSQMRYKAMVFN
jgi:hypothetical protein